MGRCTETKADGTQCNCKAIKGEVFCWQHRPNGYKKKKFTVSRHRVVAFKKQDNGGINVTRDYGNKDWIFVKMKTYAIRNGEIFDPDANRYLPLLTAIRGPALSVWIYLSSCVDDSGFACPKRSTMSDTTGYSKGTISKAIARLERLGVISVNRSFDPGECIQENSYNVDSKFFEFGKRPVNENELG